METNFNFKIYANKIQLKVFDYGDQYLKYVQNREKLVLISNAAVG